MTRDEFWDLSELARYKGWNFCKTDLPERINEPFFPLPENVFKALELISPHQVRVAIIGQDPYFAKSADTPYATGVAFGIPEGVDIPKSLGRIKQHVDPTGAGRNDLTDWAVAKGVLLINAALTVPGTGKRSAAGQHLKAGHWNCIFSKILKQTRANQPPTAVVAWGTGAKQSVAMALKMNWEQPLPGCVWSYHPVASISKSHPNSFASFWETDVGKGLCPTPVRPIAKPHSDPP